MMTFETVLSPLLLPLYDLEGKVAVVTDILRATSCMVAGFENGVKEIVPVLKPEDCESYAQKGFMRAGERGGKKIEGFDIGNSPLEYQNPSLKGGGVVVTTTNGTRALHAAKDAGAKQVLVGAFANMQAIADYIKEERASVVVLCAGWKNRYCLEDTLFAGGLAQALLDSHAFDCDATATALHLFQSHEDDLVGALGLTNHACRLGRLGNTEDLDYCASCNISQMIPVLEDEMLRCL